MRTDVPVLVAVAAILVLLLVAGVNLEWFG
jgi:hypothetical protein